MCRNEGLVILLCPSDGSWISPGNISSFALCIRWILGRKRQALFKICVCFFEIKGSCFGQCRTLFNFRLIFWNSSPQGWITRMSVKIGVDKRKWDIWGWWLSSAGGVKQWRPSSRPLVNKDRLSESEDITVMIGSFRIPFGCFVLLWGLALAFFEYRFKAVICDRKLYCWWLYCW